MSTDDLPPSAKFVLSKLADAEGECTRQQIDEATGLPRRTVTDALLALREAGLVEQRPQMTDPSKPAYCVVGEYRQRADL